MLRRVLVAATIITATAGTALAADASRPVVPPGSTYQFVPMLTGDLSISVGGLFYEGENIYNIFDTLGRVNKPLSDKLNLEVEAGGGAFFEGGGSEPYYIDAVAHLWGMHSPTSALGLYGGAIFGLGPVIGYEAGVEAKHFFANGSLGASAGVQRVCCITTAGIFTASFNHYFNPNHRIGVRAALATAYGETYWELSADVEHRFMHPISVFAQGTYIGGSYGPSGAWTVKGGVKFYLDAPSDTLQSHEMKVPWTTWVPSFGLGET